MGKKSRLKKYQKELKQHGLSKSSSKTLLQFSEHNYSIYRFFQKEEYAESFVRGEVRLSTLETCRKYEDPEQGDSEEAHETYNSGHVVGDGDDPTLVKVAQRFGITIGSGCSDITISNNKKITVLRDAYVLCTTTTFLPEKLSKTFGKYCVEITNPLIFFLLLSKSLRELMPIKENAVGEVIYRDRSYTGMESPPGPIGFVKPPDIYASQKEFRFLWVPEDSKELKPFSLQSPEIAHLCKRIA